MQLRLVTKSGVQEQGIPQIAIGTGRLIIYHQHPSTFCWFILIFRIKIAIDWRWIPGFQTQQLLRMPFDKKARAAHRGRRWKRSWCRRPWRESLGDFSGRLRKGNAHPLHYQRGWNDFDLKNGIEEVETKGYSAVPAVISLARKSSDCSWTFGIFPQWLCRGHLMTPSIWRPGVTVQGLGRGATCFESWRDAGCFIHCAVYDPARWRQVLDWFHGHLKQFLQLCDKRTTWARRFLPWLWWTPGDVDS